MHGSECSHILNAKSQVLWLFTWLVLFKDLKPEWDEVFTSPLSPSLFPFCNQIAKFVSLIHRTLTNKASFVKTCATQSLNILNLLWLPEQIIMKRKEMPLAYIYIKIMKTKKLLSTQIVYCEASAFTGHSYEIPFTMWKDRPFWPLTGWDRASQGHVLTFPCDFYVPQAFCMKMSHKSSQNTCFTDKPINALIYPPKCEFICRCTGLGLAHNSSDVEGLLFWVSELQLWVSIVCAKSSVNPRVLSTARGQRHVGIEVFQFFRECKPQDQLDSLERTPVFLDLHF